jgi:hypothetical protein
MDIFLTGFTAFNLLLALMATQKAARLMRPTGHERWASRRLFGLAVFIAVSLPIICVAATWAGWSLRAGAHFAAHVAIAAPTVWLLAMGALFAAVDFLEDGILGNALKPRR